MYIRFYPLNFNKKLFVLDSRFTKHQEMFRGKISGLGLLTSFFIYTPHRVTLLLVTIATSITNLVVYSPLDLPAHFYTFKCNTIALANHLPDVNKSMAHDFSSLHFEIWEAYIRCKYATHLTGCHISHPVSPEVDPSY